MTEHACNGERETLKHECAHCLVNEEQARLLRRDVARDRTQAEFCREMAIVALRMLQRAGKLKPTTDDERAAVEFAGSYLDLPAASRRLAHPGAPPMATDEYVAGVVSDGQAVLFTDPCEVPYGVERDAA